MISFFRKKTRRTRSDQPVRQNEILVTETDTISLGSMVFTGKRQGIFYIRNRATVETNAFVTGKIIAADAVIKGRVTGDVSCTGNVVVRSTAIIEGNVSTLTAVIEPGAIFNGALTVGGEVQISLLSERLRQAEKLLWSGHVPEVELIEEAAEAALVSGAGKSSVRKKQVTRESSFLRNTVKEEESTGGGWW